MAEKKDIKHFIENMANYISRNTDAAQEFLREEGVDYQPLANPYLAQIRQRMQDYKLASGAQKGERIKGLFIKFQELVAEKSLAVVQTMYPSLPQVAYRKFEEDELDAEEIEDLLRDGSFLTFLDEFDGSEPDKI